MLGAPCRAIMANAAFKTCESFYSGALHLIPGLQKLDYQGKQHHKERTTQIHDVRLVNNTTVLDFLKSWYYEGKMESG